MKNQIYAALIIRYILGIIYLLGVVLWDDGVMLSAWVGCMASLAPDTYQSMRMLRHTENNNAMQWLGYAYRSEFVKWVMTGMIFLLAFTANYEWDPIVLFTGFCLLQISNWFVALIVSVNC